jgi:hypothetical protein
MMLGESQSVATLSWWDLHFCCLKHLTHFQFDKYWPLRSSEVQTHPIVFNHIAGDILLDPHDCGNYPDFVPVNSFNPWFILSSACRSSPDVDPWEDQYPEFGCFSPAFFSCLEVTQRNLKILGIIVLVSMEFTHQKSPALRLREYSPQFCDSIVW